MNGVRPLSCEPLETVADEQLRATKREERPFVHQGESSAGELCEILLDIALMSTGARVALEGVRASSPWQAQEAADSGDQRRGLIAQRAVSERRSGSGLVEAGTSDDDRGRDGV